MIAVEIWKTAFTKKRKHVIVFDEFQGELRVASEQARVSAFGLTVNAGSAICWDKWLSARRRKRVTSYAREVALAAQQYPNLQFASARVSTKQLRGCAIEGQLKVRDVSRMVKVNAVLNQVKDGFQIDGDSTLRLSQFGINPPRRFFGLVRVQDEVLVRILLWARQP
jgi:polyisoprenoid-binding protein YceI